MATGILKPNSIVAVEVESTEGTYIAPQATTSYIQVLNGFGIKPSREVIDRGLITASPGKETPRMGMKSVTAQVPTEMRASGLEGADVDMSALLKGAMGASIRTLASRITTKSSGNTSTSLKIEDADIGNFAVGNMVLVLKSGAHEVRPVTAVTTTPGSAALTLGWALDGGAPGNSVQIAKCTQFLTGNSSHGSLSLSYYMANEKRMAAIGCKVASLALENFEVGKVPNWNFGLEGMNFTQIDGVAPHTPSYDTGLPPIDLNACIWRNGTQIECSSVSLNLANTIAALKTTCSANGKTAQRVSAREITGTINPYMDDSAVTRFDDFVAGTEFSLFILAYTPSSTTGEMSLGSVVGIWLPQCITTEYEPSDVDVVMVDQISFRATRGSAGLSSGFRRCPESSG